MGYVVPGGTRFHARPRWWPGPNKSCSASITPRRIHPSIVVVASTAPGVVAAVQQNNKTAARRRRTSCNVLEPFRGLESPASRVSTLVSFRTTSTCKHFVTRELTRFMDMGSMKNTEKAISATPVRSFRAPMIACAAVSACAPALCSPASSSPSEPRRPTNFPQPFSKVLGQVAAKQHRVSLDVQTGSRGG